MQLAALRHRTESEDCFALDNKHVRVRVHTGKDDVAEIFAYYTDNYMPTESVKKIELKKSVGVKLVTIGLQL